MNLNDAINSHTDWKIRLRHAISEREVLDVEAVARDDACDYGQWLHGPAREWFGALPAYAECVQAHAVFHARAADVAGVINAGDYARAERLLGPGSAYALASRATVLAIEVLKRHIAGSAA